MHFSIHTHSLTTFDCFPVYQDVRQGYHIGLHELTRTVPGEWQWLDGTPLTYDKWQPGQPKYGAEWAAMLYKQDLLMGDVRPTYPLVPFICEYELN